MSANDGQVQREHDNAGTGYNYYDMRDLTKNNLSLTQRSFTVVKAYRQCYSKISDFRSPQERHRFKKIWGYKIGHDRSNGINSDKIRGFEIHIPKILGIPLTELLPLTPKSVQVDFSHFIAIQHIRNVCIRWMLTIRLLYGLHI